MKTGLLVVNGDDGGLHADTDDALLRCAEAGLMHSISVVATGPTAARIVERAKDAGLGIGLHFNLSEGPPVGGPYRTLTRSDGFFHSKVDAWRCTEGFDATEVAAEARAQYGRLLDLGADIDHIDSHNHTHLFPAVIEGMIDALGAEDLVVRIPDEPEAADGCPPFPECVMTGEELRMRVSATCWRTAARFVGFAFCSRPSVDALTHMRTMAPTTEWMVHPGCRPTSEFTRDGRRLSEIDVLCSAELRHLLESWGYRPGKFGDVS